MEALDVLRGGYGWMFVALAFLSALLWLKFFVPQNPPRNALEPSLVDSVKDVRFSYGVCEMQGRRAYMEDRHLAAGRLNGNSKHSLYAVFDGHGGSIAAQYCVDNMEKNIVSSTNFPHTPSQALVDGFSKTDADFVEIATKRGLDDGTTAVVILVQGNLLHVANAGDSRAILVKKNGAVVPLSSDHKPDRPDEKKRVTDAGGKVVFWGVWRVQGILAVSRAIGDKGLKRFVTGTPEIESCLLSSNDGFIVLASDGIWDMLTNEEVGKCCLECGDINNAPKELVEEAFRRGSQDNMTAMVIDLRGHIAEQNNDRTSE